MIYISCNLYFTHRVVSIWNYKPGWAFVLATNYFNSRLGAVNYTMYTVGSNAASSRIHVRFNIILRPRPDADMRCLPTRDRQTDLWRMGERKVIIISLGLSLFVQKLVGLHVNVDKWYCSNKFMNRKRKDTHEKTQMDIENKPMQAAIEEVFHLQSKNR